MGIKGRTAIVGVGESTYYKNGQAPLSEFRLCLDAILAASADAGLDPREIDGLASFSDDRNEADRVATALGLPELRYANMVWGGGGGGGCAAVGNAAAAVAAGYADAVVVFRALTQNAYTRRGAEATVSGEAALMSPYGMISPAQIFGLRVRRFMHQHGVGQEALRAVALAAYHHAQRNPRALMHDRPLTAEAYDESRWIVEPFHIYDCCMANDGAAAVIVTSAERARDLRQSPAYIRAAAQGATQRYGQWNLQNDPEFASANVAGIAARLWKAADIAPSEVDVVQIYDHFTGGVVMSLCEHGFISPEEANEFLVVENLIAPSGKLPLNTSGGSIAECNIHGMQLIVEAVRQIRGTSTSQVDGAQLSFVNSGSLVTPTSNLLLGASPS